MVVGTTISLASPSLESNPSNVTSAFSDTQDRFAALNRASMTVENNGMEKLACALSIKRDIALPRVTFSCEPSVELIDVVLHPEAPAIVQFVPVKPLVHKHEQAPEEMSLVPPFWQDS